MALKKKKPIPVKKALKPIRKSYPLVTPDTYKDYIASDWWRNRRAKYIAKHPKCKLCKDDRNLEVHHTVYYVKGKSVLYGEKDTQLRCLCSDCHRKIHFYRLEKFFRDPKLERLLPKFVPQLLPLWKGLERMGVNIKALTDLDI